MTLEFGRETPSEPGAGRSPGELKNKVKPANIVEGGSQGESGREVIQVVLGRGEFQMSHGREHSC